MIYTTRTAYTVEQSLLFDFGRRDERGRAVGACIVYITDSYEAVEGNKYGYTRPPGTYFSFEPQSTRDGKKYSAVQHVRFFATREERNVQVKKYLAAALKRAAKQFPGA